MNNKGDLISREALKSALKSNCKPEICHDFGTNWCEACCPHNDFEDLIDNAPTVEPPKQLVLRARDDAELEQLKTAWGNGEICFTPIVAYTARPQGEWITVHYSREELNVPQKASMFDFVKCPFCETIHQGRHNFCSRCGADMRGEEE